VVLELGWNSPLLTASYAGAASAEIAIWERISYRILETKACWSKLLFRKSNSLEESWAKTHTDWRHFYKIHVENNI
jgi:hypothetical protein